MFGIVGCAEVGIGCGTAGDAIGFEFTDKEQHFGSLGLVMDIALSGGRVCGSSALALPVEQGFVNGIIVVHGCGRIVFVGLI